MPAYIPRTKYVCPVCNNAFFDLAKRNRKYCSHRCKGKARSMSAKRIRLRCDYCRRKFLAHDASGWNAHSQQRFCSQICKGKGIAKERGQHIRKKTTFICEHCKQPFTRTARADREYHFCSRRCHHANRRGENHHCWQGGHSNYYGPDWENERIAILERDQYTCQSCGTTTKAKKQLGIHHIIPRKEFDGDWDSANRPSNLITLCTACHARLHAQEKNHFVEAS